jgi:spore coat protein U-like protein
MTRLALVACFVFLSLDAWSQVVRSPRKPGGATCPPRPADCQINAQVFDFGRGQMSPTAPAINGFNTVSVTCTRSPQADGLEVDVAYELKAIPGEPARYMRDSRLEYLRYYMYVDPARTRYWGDGVAGGTFTFTGALMLDNRNRVGTLVHQVYGKVDAGQRALPGQWLGLTAMRLDYQIVSCR